MQVKNTTSLCITCGEICDKYRHEMRLITNDCTVHNIINATEKQNCQIFNTKVYSRDNVIKLFVWRIFFRENNLKSSKDDLKYTVK